MILDKKLIEAFALGLEAQVHSSGWDKPPVLAALFHTEADGDLPEGIAAQPFRVQPALVDPADPAGALLLIAVAADLPPVDYLPDVRDSLAGLAFVHEAWMAPDGHDLSDPRDFADVPGGVEIRVAHVMTCGGHYLMARRERGKDPEVLDAAEVDLLDATGMAGRVVVGKVPAALRALLLRMGEGIPPEMFDRDAVNRCLTWI